MFWYHDTGPELSFQNAYVNCRKNVNNAPDTNCGVWAADGDEGTFDPGTGNITSPLTIYGNKLMDSDEYYGQVDAYFTPKDYPQFMMGSLRGADFNCYGTSSCVFP